MPATTQIAPAGKYVCEHCDAVYEHKDEATMPYCPNCKIWTVFKPAK